jgi:hypothetical protein
LTGGRESHVLSITFVSEHTRLTMSDEIRFHVIRIEYGFTHSSLNTSVKLFSRKLHKNRKTGITNIFHSKFEYNHTVLQHPGLL